MRPLRVCRGKGRRRYWQAERGKGREKEVVSVCLHAFLVRIAREQGTEKCVRGEGRKEWRGLCMVTLLGVENEGCKRRGERGE